MTSHRNFNRNERGFTLTEILVATAIFTIIMVAALLLYDRSNKVFKSGVEAADLQQNTRVAFDKLVADLRMAGFDFDRDGIPSGAVGGVNLAQQPDEQIEYISNAAITIRGNFDFNNNPTADDQGREFTTTAGNSGLETPEFPVVTTGNDEIVTYALVSVDRNTGVPIAANNTDSITFYADVPDRKARVGAGGRNENLVTITGVDLSNANPPYTLMRIPVALTSAGAVAPVKIPIATGIRSLNFEYFTDQLGTIGLKDLDGVDILPADYATTVGGLGQYDPNSPTLIVPKAIRATIQSIKLTLVGMTEFPDPTYTDTADTVAPLHRKYLLETLVVPRNTGRRGLREQDTSEPGLPVITTVCRGYCDVAFVAWDAPTTGGAVENYVLYWDTSPTGPFNSSMPVFSGNFTYTLSLGDPTLEYYFKVQAINSYGNRMSAIFPSAGAGISAANATKPWPPASPTISGDGTIPPQANRIALRWMGNLTPVNTVTCAGPVAAPTTFPIQELGRWKIMRVVQDVDATNGVESAFDPDVRGEPVLTPATPLPPDATLDVNWADTTAANCFNYYYRLKSFEECPASGALNESDWVPLPAAPALLGYAESDVVPDDPEELTFGPAPASECASGLCTAQLIWQKVKTTGGGAVPVTIGRYFVTRRLIVAATGAEADPTNSPAATIEISLSDPKGADFTDPDKVIWTDDGAYDDAAFYPSPLHMPSAGQTWEYTVTAQQCASAQSGPSPARRFPCAFSPTLNYAEITGSIEGSGTEGDPWLLQPISSLEMEFSDTVTVTPKLFVGGVRVDGFPAPAEADANGAQTGTSVSFSMPDLVDGLTYEVVASVVDSNGCQTSYTYFANATSSNCCLTPVSVNADVIVPDAVSKTVRVKLQNVCSDKLELLSMNIFWNTGYSGGAKLEQVFYPAAMGACPTLLNTIGNPANGNSPVLSVPQTGTVDVASDSLPQAGLANCPDPTGREYRIDVVFSKGFTVSPITKLCIKYNRRDSATDALVATDQFCQIVPAPSAVQNVCD